MERMDTGMSLSGNPGVSIVRNRGRMLRRLQHYGRVVEALLGLILAQMLLLVLPFRHVAKWIGTIDDHRARVECLDQTPVVQQVGIAVLRAAARLPWSPVCLPRSIVANWMLRRRGIAARVYFGVAIREGELKAHAWVSTDEGYVWNEDLDFTVITAFEGQAR